MKTLFRVLGAAAAVAVTGAAIVVLDKVLNDKDPLHVEEVEFPEEAEKDAAEAAKTAEAYAEGEAKAEHTPAGRVQLGLLPSRSSRRSRKLRKQPPLWKHSPQKKLLLNRLSSPN